MNDQFTPRLSEAGRRWECAARIDERRSHARHQSPGKGFRNGFSKGMKRLLAKAATLVAAVFLASNVAAQPYSPPRTPAGDPDLQGIWQVRNTTNWDVQHHAGSNKTPAGLGVVADPTDGTIPYQPSAL